MAEKDIVTAILKYLRTVPHCFCWKEHGGMYGTAGLPDIIACIDGLFYAFEVKQPGKELTPLQAATLKKITEANGQAHKVTSLAEVKTLLSAKESDQQ